MRPKASVWQSAEWTITEKGRLDLETVETCACNPRLAGLLIECPVCGTVYGSLRDSLGPNGRTDKR